MFHMIKYYIIGHLHITSKGIKTYSPQQNKTRVNTFEILDCDEEDQRGVRSGGRVSPAGFEVCRVVRNVRGRS